MINRIRNRFWFSKRRFMLRLRGRVMHRDRYGLNYWMWANTRAMSTPVGHPGTDDTGVLEQLIRVYTAIGDSDHQAVSIDVGAQIGVISLAMARFGSNNHLVHSVEADDLNFRRLTLNVSGRLGAVITAHNTAIGNLIGTAGFTRHEDSGTNHLSVFDNPTIAATEVCTVPITTLDAFANEQLIDEIEILKIDVEGADLDVLRGAENLLGGGRIKAIIVEVPLESDNREKLSNLLVDSGMTIAYIVRNSDELIEASEAAYITSAKAPLNLLAVRADLAEKLGIGS
jgi:FkbM family methyltransferase